ncbi:protein induced by osmotic stress [Scheffersomyces xylosifermentans]|uniref:protein induced by osmotic stress n=1 Tax=Scheffersomyces xylosifermentans TaxID=1304137 RepID=UPI00315C5BFF
MPISVFVSGATGYIAQQTISLLLSKGYNVVGSVRSVAKGENLKELYGSKFQYEVVPVLEKQGAFDEALQKHPEVTVFLHTASPVTFTVEDNERDIMIPAINGTKFALESIAKVSPQISRVVYTSSLAAMATFDEVRDPNYDGGEDSYSPISYEQGKLDTVSAYVASKTLAEQAGWDFVKTHKPKFTLSVVHPAYVFGPQAKDEEASGTLNYTSEIVSSVFRLSKDDMVPHEAGHFADVRDVAKAHVLAFEKDEAKNKRILVNTENFSSQLILNIIRKHFPELKERLPVGNPEMLGLSHLAHLKERKSRELLGFEHISLEESVVDSIKQLIRVSH